MKLTFLPICLLVFASSALAEQNWYNFKRTWTPGVYDGFHDMPRTVTEAEKAGYVTISNDCDGKSKWPGRRMIPPSEHPEYVIIFDVNGYVAGMQSIVPLKYAQSDKYSYVGNKPYNKDTITAADGRSYEAYLTTALFVLPEDICVGRTQTEFDSQGTGYRLILQNGPTLEPEDLIEAKPYSDDYDHEQGKWYRHNCFINMGRHYLYNMYYDPKQKCENLFPAQLLYNNYGDHELIGFVWRHQGHLPGKGWERPQSWGIGFVVDTPPECLLDLADDPGISSMHVFLRGYVQICLPFFK